MRLCAADNGRLWLLEGDLLLGRIHDAVPEGVEYDREHPHALDRTTAAGRTAVTRAIRPHPGRARGPGVLLPGPRTLPRDAGRADHARGRPDRRGLRDAYKPQPFTEEQIALAQTFADQAAIAIANTRLLEAVERQRTELARFLSPQVAELVSSADGERLLAGHRAYITVSSVTCAASPPLPKQPRPRNSSTSSASTTRRSAT